MTATITNPLRVGLRQERVISPQCLVIFGASGDLTHRKLVPALFELFKQRRLPSEFALLGCARRPWSDEEVRSKMTEALASKIEESPQAGSSSQRSFFTSPSIFSSRRMWCVWVDASRRSTSSAPHAETERSTSRYHRSSTAVAAGPWPTPAC